MLCAHDMATHQRAPWGTHEYENARELSKARPLGGQRRGGSFLPHVRAVAVCCHMTGSQCVYALVGEYLFGTRVYFSAPRNAPSPPPMVL